MKSFKDIKLGKEFLYHGTWYLKHNEKLGIRILDSIADILVPAELEFLHLAPDDLVNQELEYERDC